MSETGFHLDTRKISWFEEPFVATGIRDACPLWTDDDQHHITGCCSFIQNQDTRVGKQGGQTTLESPGWTAARDRYQIEVVGGAKSIEVVGRA